MKLPRPARATEIFHVRFKNNLSLEYANTAGICLTTREVTAACSRNVPYVEIYASNFLSHF